MPFLEVSEVTAGYGPIEVLRSISVTVDEGEAVSLIGNNGAGKTTLLRTISGLLRPRRGSIRLAGERIDRLPPHAVVRAGIAHVPEGRGIFGRLTVLENLEMGAFTRASAAEVRADLERVLTLFPRLGERLHQNGGTLSGGEQQMLAIARALMARPRLLLLDEPSMGLSPLMVDTIFEIIRDIHRQGTSLLLVEQNVPMALAVAARGYVLEAGRVVAAGAADELRRSDVIRSAYLGEAQTSSDNRA